MRKFCLLLFLALSLPFAAHAQHHPMGPAECGDMEIWDYAMAMCMPRAMAGMPMKMLMLHGNAFGMQTFVEKPRGRNGFSVPDVLMADLGTTIGDRQYLNLDVMLTGERWTFPHEGSAELLQIGERRDDGTPYLDAQHPHSSPLMGLTLSDTLSLGAAKDSLKIWFAPRGESGDGPVAFMHRPTGVMNPDAPLGHHIGQDSGHISSTVLGASVRLGGVTVESSAFHGTEPEPAKVDLPVGPLNSYSARVIGQFTPHLYAMTSVAYVKLPEPSDPALDHLWRYSASLYRDRTLRNEWMLHTAIVWGLINGMDHVPALNSFLHEIWLHKNGRSFWTRLEVLQRTPAQLAVALTDPANPYWVTAATLGYTRELAATGAGEIGLGASLTKDFLPAAFRTAYGEPWTAKIFLQLSAMKMWDLN